MSGIDITLFDAAVYVSFLLIFAGMVLTFIRLVKGPSLPDRIVAVDLFAVFAMAIIIIYTFQTEQLLYLDASFVLAIVSLLGTVAFARFLEMRAQK